MALAIAVVGGCAEDAETDELEAEYNVIQGTLTIEDTMSPAANVRASLVIEGQERVATTDAAGRFRIQLSDEEYAKLPDHFFVTFEREDLSADSLEVHKRSGEPGTDPSQSHVENHGGTAYDGEYFPVFDHPGLRFAETAVRRIQALQRGVVHLGDSAFEGSVNSQFQYPEASGATRSFTVSIPDYSAVSFAAVRLRMSARGIQSANEIEVNGEVVQIMSPSPESGAAEMVVMPLPFESLQQGDNEIVIRSVGFDDLDDFELASIELVLYRHVTVGDVVKHTCSTSDVGLLSQQLITQMRCLSGGEFVSVEPRPNLTFGPAAYAYMQPEAAAALVAAVDEHPDRILTINSMFRTLAQQYMLRSFRDQGRCGVTAAAQPGRSNHETGLSFDTSHWEFWKPTLKEHEFKWYGASDRVHFDFVGESGDAMGPLSVKAFQTLWNLNDPENPLPVNGEYDTMTAKRLAQTPVVGFATYDGATCPLP